MPVIITTGEATGDYGDLINKDYDYEYPKGLDLKPGSPLHKKIVSIVLDKARNSKNTIEKQYNSWNLIDEKLTAYIPTTDKEKKVRDADRRKPISIVVPYSFAILETMVSYMVSAFLPEPIFRYEGSSPEDIVGAILLEKKITLDCNRTKVPLTLHTMFRDAGAYGIGIVAPDWTVKRGQKTVKKELQNGFYDTFGEFQSMGTDLERETIDAVLFEGNSLRNIDPYRYFPDPNVPVHDIQRGEFVGWLDDTNLMDLLEVELTDKDFFNVRFLHHVQNRRSSIYSADASRRMEKVGGDWRNQGSALTKPVDLINMYIKLIPSRWGLGDSDYPEKWLFTVASDTVVIRAKPLGLNHNMFPVAVCAPDFDGYSPIAVGRSELVQGMQEVLDWLFNSHIANVRKAINDMIIVDPYLVNINDMKDPGPGKLIRLRRPAWGRGVDKVAQQLQVNDITQMNIQDAMLVMKYMQQIFGTDNPMMGALRSGGPDRLTAKEFQGTAAGAVSRLERIAKVIGLQAMQDIGYMFAYHTQQLMSEEVWVNSTGRWTQDVLNELKPERGRVKISPWDILVDYDLLVRDGSVPGGNFSNVWVQIFKIIMSTPELAGRFDIMRIFKHIARNIGAKNVEEFEIKEPIAPINASVVPDAQAAAQAQVGNIVPIGT
uniref:Portal protein n=1 Tax=viral metagenome TaxID=1070528 RepID=A0A6H1ZHX5_9ZZZZ